MKAKYVIIILLIVGIVFIYYKVFRPDFKVIINNPYELSGIIKVNDARRIEIDSLEFIIKAKEFINNKVVLSILIDEDGYYSPRQEIMINYDRKNPRLVVDLDRYRLIVRNMRDIAFQANITSNDFEEELKYELLANSTLTVLFTQKVKGIIGIIPDLQHEEFYDPMFYQFTLNENSKDYQIDWDPDLKDVDRKIKVVNKQRLKSTISIGGRDYKLTGDIEQYLLVGNKPGRYKFSLKYLDFEREGEVVFCEYDKIKELSLPAFPVHPENEYIAKIINGSNVEMTVEYDDSGNEIKDTASEYWEKVFNRKPEEFTVKIKANGYKSKVKRFTFVNNPDIYYFVPEPEIEERIGTLEVNYLIVGGTVSVTCNNINYAKSKPTDEATKVFNDLKLYKTYRVSVTGIKGLEDWEKDILLDEEFKSINYPYGQPITLMLPETGDNFWKNAKFELNDQEINSNEGRELHISSRGKQKLKITYNIKDWEAPEYIDTLEIIEDKGIVQDLDIDIYKVSIKTDLKDPDSEYEDIPELSIRGKLIGKPYPVLDLYFLTQTMYEVSYQWKGNFYNQSFFTNEDSIITLPLQNYEAVKAYEQARVYREKYMAQPNRNTDEAESYLDEYFNSIQSAKKIKENENGLQGLESAFLWYHFQKINMDTEEKDIKNIYDKSYLKVIETNCDEEDELFLDHGYMFAVYAKYALLNINDQRQAFLYLSKDEVQKVLESLKESYNHVKSSMDPESEDEIMYYTKYAVALLASKYNKVDTEREDMCRLYLDLEKKHNFNENTNNIYTAHRLNKLLNKNHIALQ